MKKSILLFVSLIFFSLIYKPSFSQVAIQWQKCLGGSNQDWAECVKQTNDGGYIVAGYTNSSDGDVTGNHSTITNDYWIVKLTSSGSIEWQKCLGGANQDYAQSIAQTFDGGYIVAGYANSINGDVAGNHGDYDYWIVKLDSAGGIQWQKCLGGSGLDKASSIEQTIDGGYIVAGWSGSNNGDVTGNHGGYDYWIVKIDTAGNIQWQKSFGGSLGDEARCIKQTIDQGYIVTGVTESNDGDVSGFHGGTSYDYWLIKLNEQGTMQWQKCLGGDDDDESESIWPTTNGYIVAGYSFSNDADVSGNHNLNQGDLGESDIWIANTNNSGDIQWQKCLGGTLDDIALSIRQTNDGGYIIAGTAGSDDGDVVGNVFGADPYWIIKLDTAGNINWQKCIGGTGIDGASSIEQTTDGGYIVTGFTSSNDGDVTGNHGGFDYWVVKLSSGIGMNEPDDALTFSVFPNPAKDNITLIIPQKSTINFINLHGQIIKTILNTEEVTTIDLSGFSSGMYIIKVQSEQRWAVRKFVKK